MIQIMHIALVNSRQDKAGCNIRKNLEDLLDGKGRQDAATYEFLAIEGRLIHADAVDREIDCDLVMFISRHSSVNPVPVLTVHVTGNFRAAELGGEARTLAPAAPAMMQAVLRGLARRCPPGYRAAYEVTHHGPTGIRHPSFFVEIGSTEKEWTDEYAGRAVAESILAAAPAGDPVPLIGFGGNHYAVRQTEIALATRGAFGHIAHSREVAALDAAMVLQMAEKTGSVAAYIDKKALSKEDLANLIPLLDGAGIPRLSETDIAGMGSLPVETYLRAKELAGSLSPGSRCYVHKLAGSPDLVVVRFDPVLLAETLKADERAFLENLDTLPLIHVSGRDSRPLPFFLTSEGKQSGIINDLNTSCVKIIRKNTITATEGDFLILQRVRFDPDKARTLGVPQGPLFKELAEGRSVAINGREITPHMVSTGSEFRIHIPGLENIA
ncbi:MAG TPA: D-aminoacyl-tRNA deacylase [Methanoregulaceae archaeon]|nr:D-aminoacyl-tRNA deacylase [Methanoregulaceae archaeon]